MGYMIIDIAFIVLMMLVWCGTTACAFLFLAKEKYEKWEDKTQ